MVRGMNEDRQVLPAPYLNAVWKYHSACDAPAKGTIRKSHTKNEMNSRTGGVEHLLHHVKTSH